MHFRHIVNPRLKNIYLSIDSDGTLVVKSPKVALEKIEKLILSKTQWINKTREKIVNKKGKINIIGSSICFSYLGEDVVYELVNAKRNSIEIQTKTLFFTSEEMIVKTLDKFYLHQAKEIILPLVAYHANCMQLSAEKITFRKTRRQWGSCSGKNEISLNTSLMKLPREAIEYVVVHELAHITHKHHQKSFWDLVERFCPNYKSVQKTIKEYSAF